MTRQPWTTPQHRVRCGAAVVAGFQESWSFPGRWRD